MRFGLVLLLYLFFVFDLSNQVPLDQSTVDILNDLTITSKGAAKKWLSNICDDFGPRMVGSQNLERAIDKIVEDLRADGFSNVHTEEVTGLPMWIRGDDKATVLTPRMHQLNILAIGGSPSGLFEADAIVLNTMDELNTTDVRGKIVVFNEEWTHYGAVGVYRASADAVAAAGGVAVLVRSLTGFSIYSPHTGDGAYIGMSGFANGNVMLALYSEQALLKLCQDATIPAACITVEEALMLQRWQDRGKSIKIKIDMTSELLGYNATSRNVIFDIPGSDLASEVVIFSGHIDSWDVGQGAMDDGGGFAAAREMMLVVLNKANDSNPWKPRRTIRGIFWTAEEPGTMGAQQYFDRHFGKGDEKIVFAAESDMGAFKPLNKSSVLMFTGPLTKKISLLDTIDGINEYGIPLGYQEDGDMTDLDYLRDAGVPCANYASDRSHQYYFDFHHSNGDYINIFDDDDIQYLAAIWAAVATNVATEDVWST